MKTFGKCFSSIKGRRNHSERLNREMEGGQKISNDGLRNRDILIQERTWKKNNIKTMQLNYDISMI